MVKPTKLIEPNRAGVSGADGMRPLFLRPHRNLWMKPHTKTAIDSTKKIMLLSIGKLFGLLIEIVLLYLDFAKSFKQKIENDLAKIFIFD